MKAWERIRIISDEAMPKVLTEEEQTWDFAESIEKGEDEHNKMMWYSHVPGSYAPESIMTAAVQSMENMGYVVEDADSLLDKGMEALDQNDMVALHEISAELWHQIHSAKKDEHAPYWTYRHYKTFEDYASEVDFLTVPYDEPTEKLRDRLYAGWLSQIIGGAWERPSKGIQQPIFARSLAKSQTMCESPTRIMMTSPMS